MKLDILGSDSVGKIYALTYGFDTSPKVCLNVSSEDPKKCLLIM